MTAVWVALTRNGARTDRRSPDAALRGRTYAIPFERVWARALALAGGGLPGWRVIHCDDLDGVIHVVAPRRLGGVADVRIRISLDENAQTRVDVDARSREASRDMGASRHRIARFLEALDRALGHVPVHPAPPARELGATG